MSFHRRLKDSIRLANSMYSLLFSEFDCYPSPSKYRLF